MKRIKSARFATASSPAMAQIERMYVPPQAQVDAEAVRLRDRLETLLAAAGRPVALSGGDLKRAKRYGLGAAVPFESLAPDCPPERRALEMESNAELIVADLVATADRAGAASRILSLRAEGGVDAMHKVAIINVVATIEGDGPASLLDDSEEKKDDDSSSDE